MLKLHGIILIILSFVAWSVSAQTDTIEVHYKIQDQGKKNLKLFESDELLELSLRFDIKSFIKNKYSEEYLPALLTCYINETDSVNTTVAIKSRGKTRLDICSFPPIRINFKKSDTPDDEFRNIDKIKIVTHCEPGNQIYTLKEYLIYKLYNVLTDYSYRVRLARINYISTSGKGKKLTEYAFFIEPTANLCQRLNSVEVQKVKVTQKNIRPEVMDRMALFNYMIGNTDWSVPIYHNVTILSQGLAENNNLGIVLPYDFDYSGLINADYAIPYEGLNLTSVLERRYLGVCRNPDRFYPALKEFSDKKEEMMKVINDFPYLKAYVKKEMIRYLGGFFNNFDNQDAFVSQLCLECIKL